MAQDFNRRTYIADFIADGGDPREAENYADHTGLLYGEIKRRLAQGDMSLREVPEHGITTIIQKLAASRSSRPEITIESLRRDVTEAMRQVLGDSSNLGANGRRLASSLAAEVSIADGRLDRYEAGEEVDGPRADLDRDESPEGLRISSAVRAIEDAQILAEIGEES